MIKSNALIATVFMAALGLGTVHAEIRVELNPTGHVLGLFMEMDPQSGHVWARTSTAPENHVLNPYGDRFGDRGPCGGVLALPTMDSSSVRSNGRARVEDAGPQGTRKMTSLVVWERWDGTDWELIYSVWDANTWSWRQSGFVERAENSIDDFEPRMQIVDDRVYLVWRRSSFDNAFMIATASFVAVPIANDFEVHWTTPTPLAPEIAALGLDAIVKALPELGGQLSGTNIDLGN